MIDVIVGVLAAIGAVALLTGLGLYVAAWRQMSADRRLEAEMSVCERHQVDAEFARLVALFNTDPKGDR